MHRSLWLWLSTVTCVVAQAALPEVKIVELQPDISVFHKVVGRDYTGRAMHEAKRQAEEDGLLTKFTPKWVCSVLSGSSTLARHPSIHLSVTRWYWLKTSDRRITQFSPSGSPGFYFLIPTFRTLGPRETSLARASNETVVGKDGEKTQVFDQ